LLKDPLLQSLEPVILVAGRYELPFFDSRWSEYEASLRVIKLASFSPEEARNYLEKLEVKDPSHIAKLYEWTGGLPLFLSRTSALSSEEKAIKVLADRILEEVEPEWREAFLDMAVPDGFNADIVRRIITDNEEKAQATLDRLTEASFVESQAGLLHYLPAMRHVLLRQAEFKNPSRVAALRERLA
jgi:ATP/maltotriose-dependent transcriptional regulator MalT